MKHISKRSFKIIFCFCLNRTRFATIYRFTIGSFEFKTKARARARGGWSIQMWASTLWTATAIPSRPISCRPVRRTPTRRRVTWLTCRRWAAIIPTNNTIITSRCIRCTIIILTRMLPWAWRVTLASNQARIWRTPVVVEAALCCLCHLPRPHHRRPLLRRHLVRLILRQVRPCRRNVDVWITIKIMNNRNRKI